MILDIAAVLLAGAFVALLVLAALGALWFLAPYTLLFSGLGILGLLFAAGISETWLYVMGFDVFFLGGVWAHMRRPREPAFVPLD